MASGSHASGGYVRIFRRLWDHPAFQDGTEAGAFAWMISTAAYRPVTVRYKGRAISLERGQLAVSVRDLAERFRWSKSRCGRFLDRLETGTLVSTSAGTGVLVLTVCNYDAYQASADIGGTLCGTAAGRERDSSGTQNKEEKESKKDNYDAIAPELALRGEGDDLVEVIPPSKSMPVDLKGAIFGAGVTWIVDRTGEAQSTVRSFLGKACKDHGDAAVLDALGRAEREGAVDPKAFIRGVLFGGNRRGAGASQAEVFANLIDAADRRQASGKAPR